MKLHTTQPHPNPLLGRRGDSYNKQAFTLVELIVVITILAILGTIAFVSLQGYSRDSRNSVRITDIKTTETALELYSLQTGKYPLPDNYEVVTTTGSIDLWNKGQFDSELLRKLDRLSELPKDPKTEDLMGYSTTLQQKEYELKYNLEFAAASPSPYKGEGLGGGLFQTQAISSNSYVKGNYNGLFVVGKNNAYYSTPGLFSEASDVTSTGTFDLHQLQTQYQVKGITNSGTLITTANLSNNEKAFAVSLKGQYANNPDLTSGIYEVLANLDVTSTGQLTQFTQAVTSGKASSLIVAANNTVTPAVSYSIGKSALFDGMGYLTRTPSTVGDGKKWTWNGWVKRSKLGTIQRLYGSHVIGSGRTSIYFGADDTLNFELSFNGVSYNVKTLGVYRDTTEWMNIDIVLDMDQSIAQDRTKFYINGAPLTVTGTWPSQGSTLYVNSGNIHVIGKDSVDTAQYFDGYVSNIHFIDGQILNPTSFAQLNTTTGKWEPKEYTGVYGTNGFRLDFSSGALLGKDVSGNGNDWNVLGGVTQVSDSPTNNYATLSPLLYTNGHATLSNGNLTAYTNNTGNHVSAGGSFVLPKIGKWYWEVDAAGSYSVWQQRIGISALNDPSTLYQLPRYGAEVGSTTVANGNGYGYGSINGQKIHNDTYENYGATYSANDIIGVGWDGDTGTLNFWKNGISQGIAYTGIDTTLNWVPSTSIIGNNHSTTFVFAADDISNIPSGYKSLSTANLPQVNDKIENHFETLTYVGNGTSQIITGTNWGTDDQLVWIKSRGAAYSNQLFDKIRGITHVLHSDTTDGDTISAQGITAFNNSGFDIGNDWAINQPGVNIIAWRFRAGQSHSSSTGTLAATVSANPTLGFSIVKYTGTGNIETIEHGLGKKPGLIIIKNLTQAGQPWHIYHKDLGADRVMFFDITTASGPSNAWWNSTEPTQDVFTVGNGSGGVNNVNDFIAYVFADSDFIDIGSYTGNGSSDGPFVSTNGPPVWAMIKGNAGNGNWIIGDNVRNPYNPIDKRLIPNAPAVAEDIRLNFDFVSNGFKIRGTGDDYNLGASIPHFYITFKKPLGISQ